jgi:FkbM family methyltransferase
MPNGDSLELQRRFFAAAAKVLSKHLDTQGLRDVTDATEVAFPSASLDANAQPRFTMTLTPALIHGDLGAAHVFYHDVVGRGFEFGLRRFLDVHLRSDDVFLDVGAHWGIHALTAATVLPHQVSVVAIEVHPDNVARLRHWVELNRLEGDIEVIGKGIGDRDGEARLWMSGSTMGHSLRTEGQEPGSHAIGVDVTTIDRVVSDRSHLRWRRFLLKIDVEGSELEALNGAQRLFAQEDVAAVVWEKSAFHAPAEQARRDEAIWAFLDSRGFRHFRMEDENLGGRLLPVENRNVLCNVFSLAPGFAVKERYG